MTVELAPMPVIIREHHDLAALKGELARHPFWLAAPSPAAMAGLERPLAERLTLHRCDDLACATVTSLRDDDLPALREAAHHVFVNHPAAIGPAFPDGDLSLRLTREGFGVFFRHGNEAGVDSRARHHARIGSLEFLLSSRVRLDAYPRISTGTLRSEHAEPATRRRAVAVLDLVQDFEVLRPLLASAAAPTSPFDLRVAVTERVLKSQIWAKVKLFLDVHEIGYFTPLGPTDVVNALGQEKSLLLTASESTAAAHALCHAACRIAPPRALRVTMQHGFECVGLRHHRAHDLDFPSGVRFASDIVLTWDHISALHNLHPGEAHKCVPVGVLKAMSERAALLAEQQWQDSETPSPRAPGSAHQLLIAENLHSVRFRAPARYQRFLSFVRAAQQDTSIDLTIRSHPASRTLEKQSKSNRLKFLDDMLRTEDLVSFDGFVSPPSTIVLDAVLAGVPSAVWSDSSSFGDAVNYAGLPVVTDFAEAVELAGADREPRNLAAMKWAVDSTAALNGAHAAWNTLRQLAN